MVKSHCVHRGYWVRQLGYCLLARNCWGPYCLGKAESSLVSIICSNSSHGSQKRKMFGRLRSGSPPFDCVVSCWGKRPLHSINAAGNDYYGRHYRVVGYAAATAAGYYSFPCFEHESLASCRCAMSPGYASSCFVVARPSFYYLLNLSYLMSYLILSTINSVFKFSITWVIL